ncbi:MAG TPA: alanine racemase, partial [Spirochaetales bacterium]|nr:alanine racemase [Spirochaetales bacterium]
MDSSDQPRDGRFPRLAVDLGIIENNARFVRQACARSGIGLVAVVKSVGARIPIVAAMARGGCRSFASSRLEQLALLREAALDPGSGVPPDATTGLLRATGRSEAAAAVALADWSLQSEAAALEATAAAAEARGVRHGVTLMLDLGDLREGWFDRQELVAAALRVERGLPSLRLRGIGTNLGCYGAVLPTRENLGRLLEAAREVEDAIGRRLDVVSGGATTSLPLVARGRMPAGVNELRIGEAILCGKDLPLFHRVELPGVRGDTITLRAELLEKHVKPSYPIGARLRDAFGACP